MIHASDKTNKTIHDFFYFQICYVNKNSDLYLKKM